MMGTIVVGVIVLAIVGGIVWSMVRDRKQGKRSCGGDCSKCRGCH